jgi:hypothetical protein
MIQQEHERSAGIKAGLDRLRGLSGLIATAVTFAVLIIGGQARAESVSEQLPRVFVELFTSQGCSSCPPADRYLGELVTRKGVVAVSMPVDYWDYLGWRDTLGKRIFSQRQRRYAKHIGNGMVYTPQIVIDGRSEMIGSDRRRVEAVIKQHRSQLAKATRPALSLRSKDGQLVISIGDQAGEEKPDATVWLVLFSQQEKVAIRAGENGGRSLTYHNVVRELTPIGDWNGEALTLKLPRRQIMQRGADACVAILQQNDGGPVLAVSAIDRW